MVHPAKDNYQMAPQQQQPPQPNLQPKLPSAIPPSAQHAQQPPPQRPALTDNNLKEHVSIAAIHQTS